MKLRFFICVAILIGTASAAMAHGLGVEVKRAGERINVEAFFDDNSAADDARVTVTAEDGKLVAEGKTDAVGKWSFPVPGAGKYRVTADAGGGHVARTTFTIAETAAPVSNETETAESVISEGPTRTEITGGHWLMAVIGLVLIGLVTQIIRSCRRSSHCSSTEK